MYCLFIYLLYIYIMEFNVYKCKYTVSMICIFVHIYIYTYVTTFDSTKIPVTLDNVPNKSAGSLHQLGAKNHT